FDKESVTNQVHLKLEKRVYYRNKQESYLVWKMNGFTEEQLQTVFQICKPNEEGQISANELRLMFCKYSGRTMDSMVEEVRNLF
ncbi:Uncharacterized protein FKW44_005109, partial [Caligus rogercresseyi]